MNCINFYKKKLIVQNPSPLELPNKNSLNMLPSINQILNNYSLDLLFKNTLEQNKYQNSINYHYNQNNTIKNNYFLKDLKKLEEMKLKLNKRWGTKLRKSLK